MIDLIGITKTYRMGANEVRALDGVSLRIDEKEFVAIIGPSGSGKSTLMNIIGCLDAPDSGRYMLDGRDVSACSDRQLALVRNRKIGFIFQQFNLLPKLTAFENVELPLIYQGLGRHERHERSREALEAVGLADRMHHRPSELSGGQQQRVAIARALATHPAILLADEPTGNLDSKSGREIINLLRDLHERGNTIVLITHDPNIAREAARRVSLSDGRVVEDTAAKEEPA
jgi:putative ABC transport system ATP-binding protein